MNIISTYTIGESQADGRRYVKETHTADDGQVVEYEWLSDGSLDPQLVMQERAIIVASVLGAREAARLAVVGTSVPLTRYQFLARFTPAERVAARELAKTDPIVEDFMEMMKLSGNVSLPLARPGLAYLVGQGRLTAERAAAIGAE